MNVGGFFFFGKRKKDDKLRIIKGRREFEVSSECWICGWIGRAYGEALKKLVRDLVIS